MIVKDVIQTKEIPKPIAPVIINEKFKGESLEGMPEKPKISKIEGSGVVVSKS